MRREEIEEIRHGYDELTRNLRLLKQENESLRDEIGRRDQARTKLIEDLQKMDHAMRQTEIEYSKAVKELEMAKLQSASYENLVKKKEGEMREFHEGELQKRRELESELRGIRDQNQNFTHQLYSLKEENHSLKLKLGTLETELDTLKRD